MKIDREDNGKKGRFVIIDNDITAAEMTFTWAGKERFIIDHTAVDSKFGGKGYGKKLLMTAIEYARENDVKIIPLCPFAKKVFDRDQSLHEVRE